MTEAGEQVCFGQDPCMHVGPCGEFSDERGMCISKPADATSYAADVKMFCAVNVPPGTSDPNIKTRVNGNLAETKRFSPGSRYCWVIYWQPKKHWGGKIRFDFCDGQKVIFSKTTRWVVTEEERFYIKFAIPWLDLLQGAPCEPWILVLPGFKLTDHR